MNDAQRGLAAYKASAKQSGRKKKADPSIEESGVKLSVELGKGAASKEAARPSQASRTAPKPPTPGPATRQLLDAEAAKNGYRKVAKFLLLLGKDDAAKVLKHFTSEQIEAISTEIAHIEKIDNAEARKLLEEFGTRGGQPTVGKGGAGTARTILVSAFGEERGNRILQHVLPEERGTPFQFLNDLDHEQILLLLKNESTPTVSIILPFLKPQKAAKVLKDLPSEIQRESIRRIAKITKFNPEVIARIEGVLKERIRTQGKVITEEIDGRAALAEILKFMDYARGEQILNVLSSVDPELSQNVKDRLFTIDLLLLIDDTEVQSVFRDFDDQEIATLLKGKNEAITEKVLSNVSARRRLLIREEIENLGRMRRSDIDKATKDFVDYLVDLDEQRKIVIHWHDQIIE
ncbi:MAG TPA: flagellar motor switch protein FliG [Spirochaetia bacterium]|nr:flagellar motor switch protein FliG [Spirochaetia bacterium]